MIVKRFSGQTVEEALMRAKWELGDEAVLLSSGVARDRWWKFWEKGYQVLAATDYPLSTDVRVPEPEPSEDSGREIAVSGAAHAMQEPERDRLEEMMALLTRMDEKIAASQSSKTGRGKQNPLVARLIEQEWEEKWARELVMEVPKGSLDSQWTHLAEALRKRLTFSPPLSAGSPRIVVVIGPTGAGKTTTIAKLAGGMAVQEMRVLLITTDTFRVAASDQLETFGGILDIPVVVAKKPQDVPELIRRHDADIVLIDTPGRSIQEPVGIRSGLSVLKNSGATDVLLCMPATYSRSGFVDTARKIAGDRAVSLCLTKVDEVLSPGSVISALLELRYPLMYVTTGQGVPHDIESALTSRFLAQWLVKGGAYHG
ncbi:MAG: flagellar biosynthesis protein FlhF [Firmicutes bacterium]|jgi:flagellar biosynthesis protein FlhF|uniref:Flagellar biosynthesis protein FlhF n=1 Tax=Sulfobacillus benefaciens TaxID=453960 RepID=A0A2T2X6P6_9FIRM|nr:flagellar biosynthesis protein FlhF [Bacillota bacterium]MCL5015703.1 flagellar biosynthesis protein FlhF [Bacillota bacterium]PSR30126.1 MAG: flagellar biosynthesis protein FlhF [Sulfobacillus benefaciens]